MTLWYNCSDLSLCLSISFFLINVYDSFAKGVVAFFYVLVFVCLFVCLFFIV